MADEDEIDVLGDFSFNSCFGIPSCSNKEGSGHPQWPLESSANNWYDIQSNINNSDKDNQSRNLSDSSAEPLEMFNTWNQMERELLIKEMAKYGRNIRKISETIRTKSEAEIQALIDAEFGVNLDTPIFGLEKHEDQDDVPAVVQEEIVTDETSQVSEALNFISGTTKKPFTRKKVPAKSKHRLLKPSLEKTDIIAINPSEIYYEEDLIVGSTESIGSDLDLTDIVAKNLGKYQKVKGKKIGNHRRKVSRNYDKGRPRNRSKDLLKSPQGRQRKDSSLSDDSLKSPKMQIVLGSGQALPVSEGEQVIKIEKKKDSDPESDIEIDIDSDKEDSSSSRTRGEENAAKPVPDEAPIAVPLGKFEPMPRRQKKINLEGGGGYTIMHTAAGDLYQLRPEPRPPRAPRPAPVPLVPCRLYSADKPAPFSVHLNVSALISMDVHAHTSRAEVMGLVGGRAGDGGRLLCAAYRPARAAAGGTHCDMDPVSQSRAAECLQAAGWRVCGWHHSHPGFPPAPSQLDLVSQGALQRALQRARSPFLALITSQHWPVGRHASQYKCIHVEDDDENSEEIPTGYQLSVKLQPDLTVGSLPEFLSELTAIVCEQPSNELSVDMANDVCPQAKMTYLEKCISSIRHHMHSAGYSENDPVTERLVQGVRDVFR